MRSVFSCSQSDACHATFEAGIVDSWLKIRSGLEREGDSNVRSPVFSAIVIGSSSMKVTSSRNVGVRLKFNGGGRGLRVFPTCAKLANMELGRFWLYLHVNSCPPRLRYCCLVGHLYHLLYCRTPWLCCLERRCVFLFGGPDNDVTRKGRRDQFLISDRTFHRGL